MLILKIVGVVLFLVGIVNMLLDIISPHHINLRISGYSFKLFTIAIIMITASIGILLFTSPVN
jgi:hypothetical protein